MIEAVLLDVGGVLVMPNHELVGGVAADHDAAPTRASLDRGHYAGVAAGERPGGFDWADYRRGLLAAAGVGADRLDAAQIALGRVMAGPAYRVWSTVLPGVREGMRRLVASGVPFAIVSNADGTVGRLLDEQDLAAGAVTVVDSAAVGVDKPDPRIFAFALDALGASPAGCVHVGDTINADVDGARAAGIRPVHVDPIGWCGAPDHDHVDGLGGAVDLVCG